MVWAWILVIVGSFATLIGALDPLEGAFVIFPGSGMVALGAYLAQTRMRKLVYWGFFLIAAAFVLLLTMTALGGFGGNAPILRSRWWGLLLLPYPVGWIMAMAGIACTLAELIKGRWGWVVAGIWMFASVGMLVRLCKLLGFVHL
jgi:hypothetical protein